MIDTHIIEKHTFCTGVDAPAFVLVEVKVSAPYGTTIAIEEASSSRCSLQVSNGSLTLERNGELFPMSSLTIMLEDIPDEVRARLTQFGSPLSPDDPDMVEKALQGLNDGTLVIHDSELSLYDFDASMLSNHGFCELLNRADHIAYGTALLSS